jgi:ankyrin repeat protein
LHWASQENQCEVVNCLLEHGADIDAQDEHGFTPLVTAAGEGHSLLVTLLLDKGADPNRRIKALEDGTALHSACAYGHLDAVQALLRDDRIEINAKDSNGKRPLDYARAGKFRLIVHQMTQRGAV